MRSLLRLYLDYMKAAGLAMIWAAVTFGTYAFIRTSNVAGTVAAAMVSLALSLLVLLPVIDYLSPSHRVRRVLAAILGALVALLVKPEPRSTQKQRL